MHLLEMASMEVGIGFIGAIMLEILEGALKLIVTSEEESSTESLSAPADVSPSHAVELTLASVGGTVSFEVSDTEKTASSPV